MLAVLNFASTLLPSYCERDSFSAEPLNTITNLSFWIAALVGWRHWRTRPSRFVVLATGLLVLVGLCSGLWHWFRIPALLPVDSIPLYLFVVGVTYRGLSLLAGHRFAAGVVIAVVVGAIVAHYVTAGSDLNVASRHGTVLAGISLALWLLRDRAGTAWTWIAGGLVVYALALVAKSFDATVCASLPIGLHWIWHTLGGVAAGLSVHGVWLLESRIADRE